MLDILLTMDIGLFVIIILICIVFVIGTALSSVTRERDWLTNIAYSIGFLGVWVSVLGVSALLLYLTGKLVITIFNKLF